MMQSVDSDNVRRVFLGIRPHIALLTAADLLGMSLGELKRDIANGVIVATKTPMGVRLSREELITAAMRMWEWTAIEAALGEMAATVLPEAVRLVQLRARVPRYQRDVLVALAEQQGTSVDEVLRHELEDLACCHAEELAAVVPTLRVGLAWPGGGA
jgi:hypothetical protein